MHWVNMLAAIHCTRVLKGKLGFMLINGAAMHQQSGWLVDGQQPLVAINLGERILRKRGWGMRMIGLQNGK